MKSGSNNRKKLKSYTICEMQSVSHAKTSIYFRCYKTDSMLITRLENTKPEDAQDWIFQSIYLYILYKCNPLRVINSYFSHMWCSHIIILFPPSDLNENSYLGRPQPTKSSYLFTWFYYCHMNNFYNGISNKTSKKNVSANIPHSFLSHPFLTFYYTTVMWIMMVENP